MPERPESDRSLRASEEHALVARLRAGRGPAATPDFAARLRSAFLAGFGAVTSGADEAPAGDSTSRAGSALRRAQGAPRRRDQLPPAGTSLPPPTTLDPHLSERARPDGDDREHRPGDVGPWPSAADVAAELVRVEAEAAAARTAFREDLRRCFLSGTFPAATSPSIGHDESRRSRRRPVDPVAAAAAELSTLSTAGPFAATSRTRPGARVADREAGQRLREVRGHRRRARLRVLRGVLVAAAAVLLVAVLLPREPRWSLHLLEGDGLLAVEGLEGVVTVDDFEGNVEAFLRAGLVRTNGSRLELRLPGELVVELTPGSAIDPGGLVARPRDDVWRLAVERGEAYVRKAPATSARPLLIHTQDAEVAVLGTTVGVYCDDRLTCVCVAEGEVEVRPVPSLSQPVTAVDAGRSLLLVREGDEVLVGKPFPETLCPSRSLHDHHVCELLGFVQRSALAP